jgi:hypothetical protein
LNLSGHAFFFQYRIHKDKAVPGDKAVCPFVFVLVKLYRVIAAVCPFSIGFGLKQSALGL